MDRRTFIKALAASVISSQIPSILKASQTQDVFDIKNVAHYSHFDPSLRYGDFIKVTGRLDKHLLAELKIILSEQISLCVPPKYWRKIDWELKQPHIPLDGSPLCQYWLLGWTYSPNACGRIKTYTPCGKVKYLKNVTYLTNKC